MGLSFESVSLDLRQLILEIGLGGEHHVDDAGADRVELLVAADHLGAAHVVHAEFALELVVHERHPGIGLRHHRVVFRNEADRAHGRLGVGPGHDCECGHGGGDASHRLHVALSLARLAARLGRRMH